MKAFARLAVVLVLVLAGCSEKDEPLPPVPTPPPAPAPTAGTSGSSGSSTNTSVPTATAPTPPNNPTPSSASAQYAVNLGNAQQYATIVSRTATFNQAIQVFNASEGRFPKDLNELVTEKYMSHIPTPPRGMKYYYNPDNGDFRI